MAAEDMTSAQAMLLKSISIAAYSHGEPARIVRAVRTALADLDTYLLAGDWLALARNAAWLLDYVRRHER